MLIRVRTINKRQTLFRENEFLGHCNIIALFSVKNKHKLFEY